MPNLRRVGQAAEDRAADYLIGNGYTIVTRRKKMRAGELDIVALDGDVLVFVEVKHRMAPGYEPEGAIGRAKIAALESAAGEYVIACGEQNRETRFDLIAIDAKGLRHHKNAFR